MKRLDAEFNVKIKDKFISCVDLKHRTIDDKIKYIKLYCSDEVILSELPIDWRSNIFMMLKHINPTDFDIACLYDESTIFNKTAELSKIKESCVEMLEKLKRSIIEKYIALTASLNDYNQEMAEHLNDFYWNYFLTASMSDISYIFNSILYSQKQGEEGEKSRIINMNDVKHIKNSVYLFTKIQENSKH